MKLPASPELELALLGLVIERPDLLDREDVDQEALVHANTVAWCVLRDLHARGEPIDFAVAAEAFAAAGLSRTVACDAQERGRDTVLPIVLPLLERLAHRREKMLIGDALRRDGEDEGPEDPEVLDTLVDRLEDLRRGRRLKHELVESRTALGAYFDRLDERRKAPATLRGLPTGLWSVDRFLGGLQPGQLAIVAARPSVGKSAFAHQVVRACAATHGVLVATAEMSSDEVLERMCAQGTGLSTLALRDGRISDERWRDVAQWAASFPSFELYEAPNPTIADLRQLVARRAGGKRPVNLLVLDHLGYLGEKKERGEDTAELRGRQTKALKAIARRYTCAVLALCQLNRESEKGGEMRCPSVAELRESGKIEEDADAVLLLHRKTRDAIPARLIVAKSRNGPIGSISLRWDPPSTRFLDEPGVNGSDQEPDAPQPGLWS